MDVNNADTASSIFPTVLEIPKVNVYLLLNSCSNSPSPEANQELDKLRLSVSILGYFQAVDHGIETSFLDELYDVSKRFFALPLEEKQKYSQPATHFDAFRTVNQSLDWDDSLYLNLSSDDQRTIKLWPENPKDFRKILLGYSKKLQKLNEIILKAMAKSLNLEESCFLKQYGECPTLFSRFNSSPPLPKSQQLTLELGAKANADASALTFMIQDKEVEGLQVQIDGRWFRVPSTRHALIVSVGDQVEIMSNGIFKSRIRRFVKNSDEEIISVSVFCSPDNRNEIEPAQGLIDEKRPLLYKKVVDYADTFFQEYHHKEQRLIDALKI